MWFDDCMKWRGVILEGRYRHWCDDWDGLPIDETSLEWASCTCFHCKCGLLMKPVTLGSGPLHIHDDAFECPDRHLWNFWRHDLFNDFWKTSPKG